MVTDSKSNPCTTEKIHSPLTETTSHGGNVNHNPTLDGGNDDKPNDKPDDKGEDDEDVTDTKSPSKTTDGKSVEATARVAEEQAECSYSDTVAGDSGDGVNAKQVDSPNTGAGGSSNETAVHEKDADEEPSQEVKKEGHQSQQSSKKDVDESPSKLKHEEKRDDKGDDKEVDMKPPLTVMTEENNSTSTSAAVISSSLKKSPRKIVDYDKKYPPDDGLQPPSDEPIESPQPDDILFGRGGLTNHHKGNKNFRLIVLEHKDDYLNATKVVKPRVARKIVRIIRGADPPGRFLKRRSDGKWYDVGDKHASEKTSQALREKSQEEKKISRANNTNSRRKSSTPRSSEKKNDGGKSLEEIKAMSATPSLPSPFLPNVPPGFIMAPYPYYPMQPYPFSPYHVAGNTPMSNVEGAGRYPTMPSSNSKDTEERKGDEAEKKDGEAADENRNEDSGGKDSSISPSLMLGQDLPQNYPTEGGVFGTVDDKGHIIVTDRDILCGRGGATNHHKGNKRFRDIVSIHRPDYVKAPKVQKPNVARLIVKAIRSSEPPGRFLKKNDDGLWVDIGDKKATEKSSQALREKPMQDKKALQKLTPESVPLYMQGFVGGGTPSAGTGGPTHQFVYYAPMIPGQHLNPTMDDIMHSSAQKLKVDGGEKKTEEKEEPSSNVEEVTKEEDATKKTDEGKAEKKRKSTELGEDIESLSESKHQKFEESKEEEKIVSI